VLDLESETLGDAWQLLKDLRRLRPELRIVAISDREDVETLQRTFRAGARGYVSKRDEPAMVLRALDWLCQTGERFLGDCVKERVLDDVAAERVRLRETGVDALSEREQVVFRLIGAKEGPTRISQLLGVSVKTVESHQERIKVKLGVTGLTELKRRAVEWSLAGPKRQMESKGYRAAGAIIAFWATLAGALGDCASAWCG
jgi:DNA-binding NarL/FixJ family response regulator